ncbi:hypothetical protein [Bacillus massilinigeriensis]|nr:hypothetical protein [Bacillus massilionigeriensis]
MKSPPNSDKSIQFFPRIPSPLKGPVAKEGTILFQELRPIAE